MKTSWSILLPLKRKQMNEETKVQFTDMPKKRKRTETEKHNVKRHKTKTHTVKSTSCSQKACPLSTEIQSEPSYPYHLRSRKNTVKRKRMDEGSEPQFKDMSKKHKRTETEDNDIQKEKGSVERNGADTLPVKSPNLQKGTCKVYNGHEDLLEDFPESFSENYIIGMKLGRGGFGTVYAGVRKSDEKKVAVKYLTKDVNYFLSLPNDTRKVPLEAVLLEFLSKPYSSPYVIKLLEWFETPKGFLLILERPHKYITLRRLWNQLQGGMSERMAGIIMWQVVKATLHCWNNFVVHQDLKTDNILVNPKTLRVKLIDFGCGCLYQDRPFRPFGGPPVFVPKFWIAENANCLKSDCVYALGSLLYQLMIGKITTYKSTPQFIDGLSEGFYNLVNWCMEGDATKQPNFVQVIQHEWFQDKIPFRKKDDK